MKHSYNLSARDPADESVRQILGRLFHTLRSKIGGVIEDADTECLHDLRVANRRTRTVLSQIKGVLPASVPKTYQPEFKWLGDVTGSCRDLDVFLAALDSSPHEPGALDPLQDFLRERRRREQTQVCAALRSERFQRLVDGWGRFLEPGTKEEVQPPLTPSPIIDVAGPQILKAYRRMRKRGKGVDADSPAALLHRLRIDGKKLRYLLEFFSDLYPRSTVTRFIKELKQLQDVLGEFNDTMIQLALIGDFVDHGNPQEETLAATARVAGTITERQHLLRSNFVERFELFTSESSRKLYKRTFEAGRQDRLTL